MGKRIVGRNILNNVCAFSRECPPHIPIPEPPVDHKKGGKAENLLKQVFWTLVNCSDCSLNQVFGMEVWQGKCLSSRFLGLWFIAAIFR